MACVPGHPPHTFLPHASTSPWPPQTMPLLALSYASQLLIKPHLLSKRTIPRSAPSCRAPSPSQLASQLVFPCHARCVLPALHLLLLQTANKLLHSTRHITIHRSLLFPPTGLSRTTEHATWIYSSRCSIPMLLQPHAASTFSQQQQL